MKTDEHIIPRFIFELQPMLDELLAAGRAFNRQIDLMAWEFRWWRRLRHFPLLRITQ